MAYESEYQLHKNGPLTPETIAFLDQARLDNHWSYKQLGERLNISGPYVHNLLNKDMNITTNSYMPRIAEGIDRLKAGKLELSEQPSGERVEGARIRDHSYHLRDDMRVTFRLPANLTEREAERLSLFIRSLAE